MNESKKSKITIPAILVAIVVIIVVAIFMAKKGCPIPVPAAQPQPQEVPVGEAGHGSSPPAGAPKSPAMDPAHPVVPEVKMPSPVAPVG